MPDPGFFEKKMTKGFNKAGPTHAVQEVSQIRRHDTAAQGDM